MSLFFHISQKINIQNYMPWLERTELLLGTEKLERLKKAEVLVAGLGGVGAYAAEMICRAGVGKMTIADADVVEATNRNRQLPALISTNGKLKTEVLRSRFYDINPELRLTVVNDYLRDNKTVELLESRKYDYVVDAIDTLSPKVYLISHCIRLGLNVVSSLGAGGKLDPSQIRVADISETYTCKLGRMMRRYLGKLGIEQGVKVVFSPETVPESAMRIEEGLNKKSVVGTISYMPPAFGCFIASVVINDLLKDN